MEALRQSWDALCRRAGLADPAGMWECLRACYAEPHRAYHGPRHIAQLIGLLEEMRAGDELLLAGWFHDAVYLPGCSGNEADSATLASDLLRRNGLDQPRVAAVCAAIRATATHEAEAHCAPLLDADLAILGATPAQYAAYRNAIRREYATVPEDAFRAGRLAFVRSMLARPRIYLTPLCRTRFEAAAQRNLRDERRLLEAAPARAPCA